MFDDMSIWFWVGLAIAGLFVLYILFTLVTGKFRRVFMGRKIITVMLIVQVAGLLIMVASLLVFFMFPDSIELANTLLQIGLLCAIPAAIYLVVYALYIMFEKKPEGGGTYHTTVTNTYIQDHTEELKKLEADMKLAMKEENERLQAALLAETSKLNTQVAREDTTEHFKEVKCELEEQRKMLNSELEALRRDLANQQTVASIATTVEAAAANSEINKDLEAKIDELKRALAHANSVENEKALKQLRNKEARALAAAEKRRLLSHQNISDHIEKYFIETAACFLMDRDKYKDRFGLSPYNRVVVTKREGKPDEVKHVMMATPDKLYKFCEILVDTDRFVSHKSLYPMFMDLTKEGTSLVRISEKLHLMYLQFYKKDFVKDYRYKEDFENLLVTVSHRHVVKGYDFSQVFKAFPFRPSEEFTEDDIVDYLKNPDLQHAFNTYFPNFGDLGFESMYQALVIAFIGHLKHDLDVEILIQIITKDANKLAKRLVRESAKKKRR